MQTEAVFEDIGIRIQNEIKKAQKSIFVAVAWFTNKGLFNELAIKAKNGCKVYLIISNDEINQKSSIDFCELETENSKVYKIGNGETELMHNKFCVIDNSTIITGSYNWSYKAENNFENVIITTNDTTLAEQFINEFKNIVKKYFPEEFSSNENVFPLNKIIKRLEILKNYIQLEDIDEIKREAIKLNEYEFNGDISEILVDLRKQEYSSAIRKIENFISRNHQLARWSDPEIAALNLKIKNLENQLNGYDNEKIELEKLLSEFQHRHTIELGDIIIEILKLRKQKFRFDKSKYEEAEKDESQYKQQVKAEKEKFIFDLTDEQKIELKKKFRKATVLCHPDKVNDKFKDDAQKIFIELKDAYDKNDLKKVSDILNHLETGSYFKSRSETITEKDLLISAIAKLRHQISVIMNEIITIKDSDTFKIIVEIKDWDEYFSSTKEKLKREFESLRKEIGNNEDVTVI